MVAVGGTKYVTTNRTTVVKARAASLDSAYDSNVTKNRSTAVKVRDGSLPGCKILITA